MNKFAIAILGIPCYDTPENLDLLLFDAMQITHADIIVPPLDQVLRADSGLNGHWAVGPKAKMRLRCTIAASYGDDPGIELPVA